MAIDPLPTVQPVHERTLRVVGGNGAAAHIRDQRAEVCEVTDFDQPLLTVEDVRDVLNLGSVRAVYRLVRYHALPHRQLGRALRFEERELEAWTRRQRKHNRQRFVVVPGA